MKSLRMKLFTGVSFFVIALALLIVGVWAVGESQTITMSGSVNFEIADKSLYVQDVRMQEEQNSEPYSLKAQGKFIPGFINGNFYINLGDFTNTYGSFALYFDIINTMDETTGETFAYTVEQPTAPSGTIVSVSILGSDGEALDQIPQGTFKPSQIQSTTQVSATIKLVVTSTPGTQIDLSEITITINQFIPEVYDYFTFEVNEDGKTVTLTAYNSSLSDSKDIVIPAKVDYVDDVWQEGSTYTVTAIDNNATSYLNSIFRNSGITGIEFPSTLQTIGSYAFYSCKSLTEINLSGCTSLTSIGESAFNNCAITSLDLSGCTSLISIGDFAFRSCDSLTGVNLSSCTSLTGIGDYAFEYCSGLTSISLPSSLTSIGSNIFWDCAGLESIIVEEGNSVYHSEGNCLIETDTNTLVTGCKSSVIPSYITSIRDNAFWGCSGLTNIILPSSLTSIGSSVFRGCSGLTSIILPSRLTSIAGSAFQYCSGLESITVEEGNSVYHSEGNCIIETNTNTLVVGCKSSVIPSYITSIGDYAFWGCSGLTGELDLSNRTSLASIGDNAFLSCTSLTGVDLSGCTSLTSIGDSAFYSCDSLTEVNLSGCTSLTSIGSHAFYSCNITGDIVIPASVTSIGNAAFYNCERLTKVDLSDCTSLTRIGKSAFFGCEALETVAFPTGSTG